MCPDERNCTLANPILENLAELVASLLLRDTVHNEASVGIKEQAEVLVSLGDGDDIHEACWVGGIRAHLAVHSNEALHQNRYNLLVSEGISAYRRHRWANSHRSQKGTSRRIMPQLPLPATVTSVNTGFMQYVDELQLLECNTVHQRACTAQMGALPRIKDALEPVAQNNHDR